MDRRYVVTNSIRHLDELHSSKFVKISISNFELSVFLCIEADLRDQIRVGKRFTRSACVRVQIPQSPRDLNFQAFAKISTLNVIFVKILTKISWKCKLTNC